MAKAKAKTKSQAKPNAKPKATAAAKKSPAAARSGAEEAAAWVHERGLSTAGKTRWNVEIVLDVVDRPASEVYSSSTDTRFHLAIYRDEWGLVFVHDGKSSHIRRTADDQFVNGHDQHKLIDEMPALANIGAFVRALEAEHGIAFKRQHAFIRSNLKGAKERVRAWLAEL